MPQELRRIVFSHSESTEALIAYGKKFDMLFSSGNIIRANFAGNSEYEFHSMKQHQSSVQKQYNIEQKPRSVIVTFFDAKTLEHKYFNLTADFISSALIEYCIAHKIILPKQAKKSLDISEFNIVLDVAIDTLRVSEDGSTSTGLSLED
ncbi:MAG: hypothetical protein DI586_06850 [Micavibrio aeruginosavorus]|uniref:Uncharacterized protein n=1 Tax=Micavibrio aeruginosavorus TaxID=349221 RepID=A0A2W5FNL2_9BACT|nr:MAG: hypothetical protein DI586_06850 [Micavibrio aeruginosavorus]